MPDFCFQSWTFAAHSIFLRNRGSLVQQSASGRRNEWLALNVRVCAVLGSNVVVSVEHSGHWSEQPCTFEAGHK